jgi:hypothetical protein
MPIMQSDSVPAKMQPVYDEITALTDAVCREHLDDDYVQLARKMTAALARKFIRNIVLSGFSVVINSFALAEIAIEQIP